MSTASHLGFIRFKPLVGLLVLGGLVYGGMAFWPVADQYYRLWRAAQGLARQCAVPESPSEPALEEFCRIVYADTGMTLTKASVNLERPRPGEARVTVGVMLPYRLPWTDDQRTMQATIRAVAGRGGRER